MKIHWPLAKGVVDSLQDIFNSGYQADKVIERKFKTQRQWGARDRRFIAETVYDMVRWWRRLLYSVGIDWTDESLQFHLSERVTDRIAQPRHLEEQYWEMFAAWLMVKGQPLPHWPELDHLTPALYLERWHQAELLPPTAYSVPDWLYKKGFEAFGRERWHQLLQAMNETAPAFLRTNTLKITPQKLVDELKNEKLQLEAVPDHPTALRLLERQNVFSTEAFKKGYFEMQDLSSQSIAYISEVKPGLRVVDACAGAGGKSLHMAAEMQNKGKIIAMDIHEWKLKELRKRASRAGVDIIEVRSIDGSKVFKRLEKTADRLLLDVPCSGMGVLRRNPDSKWKFTEKHFQAVLETQREILNSYSPITKVGGKLIYATCSIFPEENLAQVEAFVSENPEAWEIESVNSFFPDETAGDGFFAARLLRKK